MLQLRHLLGGAACAACAILTACEVRAVGFDAAAPGHLPAGWAAANGDSARWEIIQDETAPSKPYVLAQLSAAPQGVFSLAILEGEDVADGSVSVRFKPVAGQADRAGGLVWRYRDAGHYYLARASALANNLAVFKVVDGKPALLAPRGKPEPAAIERRVPSQSWSTLKVKFRGARFQLYFNHRQLLEVEDGTLTGPGKAGLLTQADSVIWFDDFRLERKR